MTENDTAAGSIGERLHKARLRKKATLDQVYKEIKVHPKILSALEEGRYDEFLNPTYIKAFLKSYCRYLELDANTVLADYDRLPKPAASRPVLEFASDRRQPATARLDPGSSAQIAKKWGVPAAAILILIVAGVFIVVLATKVVVKIRHAGRAQSALARPAAPIPPGSKALSIPAGEPLTLTVKTKNDVWLQVKCDDKIVFENVLKKGSVETYKADNTFHIWTGKADSLDLVLNGHTLGSPGGGVLRNIILSRDGLKVEKK